MTAWYTLKIDQHEELFELERETGLGDVFRQMINKALATKGSKLGLSYWDTALLLV